MGQVGGGGAQERPQQNGEVRVRSEGTAGSTDQAEQGQLQPQVFIRAEQTHRSKGGCEHKCQGNTVLVHL